MPHDNTTTHAQLADMLDSIEPTWELREATATEGGYHIVYRLLVETPDGERECFLKATPPERSPSVHLETRLLAGLDAESDIPVPEVFGTVDEHEDLPAPFCLTGAMPGEARMRTTLASTSDEELRSLARQTGRYLASLHELDVVDGFGFLTHDGPTLSGTRPTTDFSTVRVTDPIDSWHQQLQAWADNTLAGLDGTQFADVAPGVRPAVERTIDAVEGEFRPVLTRVDQSLENLLVADGEITALLDWEFTIAGTPAYDIVCVNWSLAGGPYLFGPIADRRDVVRSAVLDGYSDRYSGAVIKQYHANRDCYELLATLRSMVHLESWFRAFEFEDEIADAATQLRAELDERLTRL